MHVRTYMHACIIYVHVCWYMILIHHTDTFQCGIFAGQSAKFKFKLDRGKVKRCRSKESSLYHSRKSETFNWLYFVIHIQHLYLRADRDLIAIVLIHLMQCPLHLMVNRSSIYGQFLSGRVSKSGWEPYFPHCSYIHSPNMRPHWFPSKNRSCVTGHE